LAAASSVTCTATTPPFGFSKDLWAQLVEQGRIVDHPVFPGKAGPAARRIHNQADVEDVIELLRLNCDRIVEQGPLGLVRLEPPSVLKSGVLAKHDRLSRCGWSPGGFVAMVTLSRRSTLSVFLASSVR